MYNIQEKLKINSLYTFLVLLTVPMSIFTYFLGPKVDWRLVQMLDFEATIIQKHVKCSKVVKLVLQPLLVVFGAKIHVNGFPAKEHMNPNAKEDLILDSVKTMLKILKMMLSPGKVKNYLSKHNESITSGSPFFSLKFHVFLDSLRHSK